MSALSLLLHLLAAACLAPVGVLQYRRAAPGPASDGAPAGVLSGGALYWAGMALAAAGPAAMSAAMLDEGWRTGFALSLWISVAATMALFAVLAAASPAARRLAVLLSPYLLLLALIATIWSGGAGTGVTGGPAAADWIVVHIVLSVAAYATITLAAVAALAVLLQERALKRRTPSGLTRRLPAAADAERLEHRLLVAAEVLLGLGVATGIATLLVETGRLFVLDHKTVLTGLAFLGLAALLWARGRYGLRGRRAARYALSAYLLVTLGYPGVKFVVDVLA